MVWAKNDWVITNNKNPSPQDLDDLANSIRMIGVPGQPAGSIQVNYNSQDLVNLRRLAFVAGSVGVDLNGAMLNGSLYAAASSGSGGRVNVTFENQVAPAAGNRVRVRLGTHSGYIGTDLHPYLEAVQESVGPFYTGLSFGTFNGSALQESMRITALGLVVIPGGGWNTGHFVMGDKHLWFDSSSRLRSKVGAPVSDTDGVVVGTQA